MESLLSITRLPLVKEVLFVRLILRLFAFWVAFHFGLVFFFLSSAENFVRWCEEEESQGLPRGQASQQTYFFSIALFPAISSFAAVPSLEPRPRREAPAASGGGRQASWSPHRPEHRPVQPTLAFFSTRNTKTTFIQPEICTSSRQRPESQQEFHPLLPGSPEQGVK